jgi:hypothetical protein
MCRDALDGGSGFSPSLEAMPADKASMADIETLLREAMLNRVQVRISYRTDPPGTFRIAEPYVLYEAKPGSLVLDVYQVAGQSSAPLPEWRSLYFKEITRLEIRSQAFTPRPEFEAASVAPRNHRLCWIGMEDR